MRILLLPVLLAVFGAPVDAQPPQPAAMRVLRATRATHTVRVDGVLDDPDWSRAQMATDFVQRYPDPGRLATLRTEVRVLYDAEAMYVGARMFDTAPDSIEAPLARRDPDGVLSDWFDVIFDSYHDRRTGYRFGVNPAGTKLDVYHFDDGNDDASWDARWDVATRIDSLGWTAEFRIPLSQLRFHGAAGEQTWGLQFYRAVARRDEWSHWAPYPPTTPGFVSAFGELRGLVGLEPPSPVEVAPYASSHVAGGGAPPESPFGGSRRGVAVGADVRVGIGNALSLTAAINPDFGQVEVDPAVINLSAVETFFPERRPFFLESAGIFEFGSLPVYAPVNFSRFVHWRRIGRTPQITPNAAWTDEPDQTTILGAAKLSGQLGGGWSLGIVSATTRREQARVVDLAGRSGVATVEPFTNYLVLRAKRDFDDGRSSVGVLSTAANRSLDDETAAALRAHAYLVGVDGSRASRDRRWTLGGYAIGSRVDGSSAAIAATQRSSVRYYGRPDAAYLPLDSTRRSLDGHDAALGVVYQGTPWFGSIQGRETSPGFESNDLGYLSRSDMRSVSAASGATHTSSEGVIRDGVLMGFTQQGWNFGGAHVLDRTGLLSYVQLQSFWNITARTAYRAPVVDDRITRGGPSLLRSAAWEASASIVTDGRRRTIGRLIASLDRVTTGDAEVVISTGVTSRLKPSLQLSLTPTLDLVRNRAQYIRTVADPLAAGTFGNRYVFADLRQRTLSLDLRADWTLTTALSVQLFTQPVVSSARFADYTELAAQDHFVVAVYGRDRGTVTTLGRDLVRIDPDGAGPAAAFVLGTDAGETSFLTRALRVNAVLRWEYTGGSALYLVWQQTRDGTATLDDTAVRHGLDGVLGVAPRNVVYLKIGYRLGR